MTETTETKFTPGPWIGAPEGAPGPMWWNVLAGSDAVASYCRLEDARLIAAAPELYAAAKLGRTVLLAMIIEAEQRGAPRPADHWTRRDLAVIEAALARAESPQ